MFALKVSEGIRKNNVCYYVLFNIYRKNLGGEEYAKTTIPVV
jgi:hypothetical protein